MNILRDKIKSELRIRYLLNEVSDAQIHKLLKDQRSYDSFIIALSSMFIFYQDSRFLYYSRADLIEGEINSPSHEHKYIKEEDYIKNCFKAPAKMFIGDRADFASQYEAIRLVKCGVPRGLRPSYSLKKLEKDNYTNYLILCSIANGSEENRALLENNSTFLATTNYLVEEYQHYLDIESLNLLEDIVKVSNKEDFPSKFAYIKFKFYQETTLAKIQTLKEYKESNKQKKLS